MLAELSQWILIATLSQAPQEADWLKVIPADVDVAIHVARPGRGSQRRRGHAQSDEPGMGQDGREVRRPTWQIREKHGEHGLKAPWVGMFRLGDPDVPGGMAYGIVVAAADYKA